jgi:hypothetical protein
MKYLCMVFFDEKKLEALSASELQALDYESLAYHDRDGRLEDNRIAAFLHHRSLEQHNGLQCLRIQSDWTKNVSTLSELLRKAAAGSEDEAGAEQVG